MQYHKYDPTITLYTKSCTWYVYNILYRGIKRLSVAAVSRRVILACQPGAMNALAIGLCVALPAGAPVLPTTASLCDRFYDGTAEEQLVISDEIISAARAELGLPKLAAGQALARSRKFFLMNHGVHTCDDNFMYKVVWKGANDFFSHNFNAKCNSSHRLFDDVPATGFLYSFVRDPMSHFISGFREATLRTFQDCCEPPHTEGDPPTNNPQISPAACSAARASMTAACLPAKKTPRCLPRR